MADSPSGAADRIRVAVVLEGRRIDLVVPARLPVEAFLASLAASTEAGAEAVCPRLWTSTGRPVQESLALADQGVGDGDLLHLTTDQDPEPPRHDDVASAVAEVVRWELPGRPVDPRARAALTAAGLLLTLGLVALVRSGPTAAPAAGIVAVLLVGAAAVVSRQRHDHPAGVLLVLVAAGYAAATGVLLAWGTPGVGAPVVSAGLGASLAALLGMAALASDRLLLLPAAVPGVLAALGGVLLGHAPDPEPVLVGLLAAAVVVGEALPWVALGLTTVRSQPARASSVDPGPLRRQVRIADRALVGMQGAIGVLLLLLLPVAVRQGVAGTALAVVGCLVVLLAARRRSSYLQAATAALSAGGGLVVVSLSALRWHPGWSPVVGAVLVGAAALAVAAVLAPRATGPGRGWLADLLELGSLVSLPPLLVVATGLLDAVRD